MALENKINDKDTEKVNGGSLIQNEDSMKTIFHGVCKFGSCDYKCTKDTLTGANNDLKNHVMNVHKVTSDVSKYFKVTLEDVNETN